MKKIGIAVLSTCLLAAAGSAFAQDSGTKAEQQRKSSEMMKPQTNSPGRSMDKAPMASPMSEADRKVEEKRKSSEMMKPQTNSSAGTMNKSPTASPMSESDKKAEEAKRKSEMMKPK